MSECRCDDLECLPCVVRMYPGETIGERIGQARRLKGWTQHYLARRYNLSKKWPHHTTTQEATTSWERDKRYPRRRSLFKLASVLCVSVGWLEKGEFEGEINP